MVGNILREEREKQGLSLRDIASQSHIRLEYLRAIEESNFEKIPAEIYVKGFLRTYAQALKVDEEAIIQKYLDQRRESEPPEEVVELPKREPRFRNKIEFATLILISSFIAITLFIIINRNDTVGKRTEKTFSLSPIRNESIRTKISEVTEHSLRIIASDTTWILMVTDNEIVEEYLFKRGDQITRNGNEGFHIKIGNAEGVNIVYNNKDIGKLGEKGEVLRISLPDTFQLEERFKEIFFTRKSLPDQE